MFVGGAAVAVCIPDGDTDYRGSAEVASGARWNRATSPPSADTLPISTGSNKPGESATRADGFHKMPCVNTTVARVQGPWPPRQEECEIFNRRDSKRVRLNSQTLVARQADAGDAPSSDVRKRRYGRSQ